MVLKKSTKLILTTVLVAMALVLIFLLDEGIIGSSYTVRIVRLSFIYALIGVSMNLVNGFTGLFSLGQAGFMAIGAYTVGVLTIPVELRPNVYYLKPMADWLVNVDVPFGVALLIGGLFAAVFAALIVIRAVIANDQLASITNGSLGLKSIPAFENLFVPALICAGGIGVMALMINSTYGRAFKAIREDEIAAEAMGINLFKHKELSFAVSAFFAGIGGGLLAVHLTAVDSNQFKIMVTYEILLIIVLGGMGSITGTCIAAFAITAGKEWLRFFDADFFIGTWQVPFFRPGLRMVIFSLLLMAIVLFYRKGLMGTKEFSWDGIFTFFHKLKNKVMRIGKKQQKGGVPNEQ